MRILRLLLQAITIGLGSLFVAVAFNARGVLAGLGVLAFFGILFLFTLLLREHTESRLVPGRKFNPKVRGAFLVFPGVSLCWVAWSFSFGRGIPLEWQNQSGMELAGVIGLWALASVLFFIGIQVTWAGYRVFRSAA